MTTSPNIDLRRTAGQKLKNSGGVSPAWSRSENPQMPADSNRTAPMPSLPGSFWPRADSKHDQEFRAKWHKEHSQQHVRDEDDELEVKDAEPPITVVRKKPRVGRNTPCPCGSGRKYKHCCGKGGGVEETDLLHASAMSEVPPDSQRMYPVGTVACYGPDDKRTTKIVAAAIEQERAEPILERWMGTNVKDNPKVQRQIKQYFEQHRVRSVVATDGNIGYPHEEGKDFEVGGDCPFCPFWKGKQGSGAKE